MEVGRTLDTSRVHFPGKIDYESYLALLQRSDAHVYLTYPFVASWSLREAMATGCAIVGSDTAPVREFITSRQDGCTDAVLRPGCAGGPDRGAAGGRPQIAAMRVAARRWAEENLDMDDYLRKYEELIGSLTGQPAPRRRAVRRVAAGYGSGRAGDRMGSRLLFRSTAGRHQIQHMTDYLARLNPEQRAAVETVDGPLLVLAGAGTGKTRVLTTRFAHILLTRRAFPNQVLAVTFTNKAAREMRERVGAILGQPAEGLWLGTFHALCARMLRRHAQLAGLQSNFTILDTDDQLRLLKQVMEAGRIDPKRWAPHALMGMIQRWKDRGLTPARVTAAEDTDFAGGQARALYAAYQARLAALNAADFGDLLLHVTEMLRSIRRCWRSITACSATSWWTSTRTPT